MYVNHFQFMKECDYYFALLYKKLIVSFVYFTALYHIKKNILMNRDRNYSACERNRIVKALVPYGTVDMNETERPFFPVQLVIFLERATQHLHTFTRSAPLLCDWFREDGETMRAVCA